MWWFLLYYLLTASFQSACNFIKKESLAQVFSCEFCEISKSTFFTEHLRTTASSAHIASLPSEVYNHASFFMWICFKKSSTKKSAISKIFYKEI